MSEEAVVIEEQEQNNSYNRMDKYMPTEYAVLGYKNGWKKCRCGRIVPFFDHWCGGCGQKLGTPEPEE